MVFANGDLKMLFLINVKNRFPFPAKLDSSFFSIASFHDCRASKNEEFCLHLIEAGTQMRGEHSVLILKVKKQKKK